MLLTLSQSTHADLGGRSTHDFPSRFTYSKLRVSPLSFKADHLVTPSRASSLDETKPDMATPHRGLPPPAAMQLPDPNRPPPPVHSSVGQPLGSMPAPPSHWQGQEDSMRNWLTAKAEEDRRRQEEEKTRQESLKLEQRRIEQSMLRESLQAGIPPQMVPMIYAGIGGAGLVQLSAEWLHQYATQLQMSQQQSRSSPELRPLRTIGQIPYPAPLQQQQQPYTVEGGPAPGQTYSAYPRNAPTSAPRALAQASLPRLATNEVFVAQPPNNPGSAHPLQQAQHANADAPASSPSIYFLHWVPPGSDTSKNPQTPATKTRQDEPSSARPGSHQSEGEYRDSPRKRKAQGAHQANPPPTTTAPYGSPSFSTVSSVSNKRISGHSRNRSTASFKEEHRPDSRKEEHRFSFVPPIVPEMPEEDDRPSKLPALRESSAAGADAKQGESQHQSGRTSVEEPRPPQAERG